MGVPGKGVREHEFAVFAALDFDVYPVAAHVMPHFARLLHLLDDLRP